MQTASLVVVPSILMSHWISSTGQDAPPASPSNPGNPLGRGDGSGGFGNGGGGRRSFPPLERAEELRGLLNAYPHPAVAFEIQPGVDAGRVHVSNERLEVVFGYTAAEAARLSLQHFLVLEEISQLDEALRRLAGGGSVYLEAAKCRSKAGITIDSRMTLSATRWADKPLGLCVIEDSATCRKTLAGFERSKSKEETEEIGICPYATLVLFYGDIRNVDSKFHTWLKMPMEKCPLVEIRLTRAHSADHFKDPLQNANFKTALDLLNMFTQKVAISAGKRIVIRSSQDGVKWTDLIELLRDGNRFKPVTINPASRAAS